MKKILALLLIACLLLAVGCSKDEEIVKTKSAETKTQDNELNVEHIGEETESAGSAPQIEDVTLTTEDSVNIAATYYPGEGKNEGIILLHMLDSDRSAWDNFARKLMDEGYQVIAPDFRGHGDSDLDWHDFNDNEREEFNDFVNMEYDAVAAEKFLKKQGVFVKKVIGASIGANIALRYAADNPEIEKLVLLSLGVKYKGVDVSEAATTYLGDVLFIYAVNDAAAADAGKRIPSRFLGKYMTLEDSGSKHGTDLLGGRFDQRIINWLE